MKILCVIDSLGSGGAQRQLVELAIGFKERGHEVSFLVYHGEDFFRGYLDEVKISVNVIVEKNYLKRLFKMRNYIRKGNYNAVLSFLEAANFICEFAGLPWRKWKLIVGERSSNPQMLRSPKLRFFRWFHIFAGNVVANSYYNMSIVRKINPLLPKTKCSVIYNMIDFERWKPSIEYIPLKHSKLTLVVVASHGAIKNLKGLVSAVNLLTIEEKGKIIIKWYGEDRGDTALLDALKTIEKNNLQHIFEFHPPKKNIISFMHEADCLGLFSLYEGLPNTICEGMALGKMIVASKISDLPLIFQERFLFDPYSPISISQVLKNTLALSSEELLLIGRYNQEQAKMLFNKEKILNKYLSLLSN